MNSNKLLRRFSAQSEYRFEYCVPYKISYDKRTEVVSVHEAYVSRSYESTYSYINRHTPLSCMVNYLYFDKSYNSKDYRISLDLRTNLTKPLEGIIHSYDENGKLVDNDFLKVILVYYDSDDKLVGFTPLNMEDYTLEEDAYTFGALLESDLKVFNNSLRANVQDVANQAKIDVILETEGTRMEIVVYQKDLDSADVPPGVYPGYPSHNISNIFDFTGIELFKNVSHLVTIQSSRPNNNQYMLFKVPLVQKEYVDKTGDTIFKSMDREMVYMNSKYEQTEQNYSLRLILSNTYGKSTIFKAGLYNDILSRVNLSMNFRIRLVKGAKIDAEYLRNYIVKYLDGIDFLNMGDFHISGLIDDIKDNIEDVQFIEFENMNEYDYSIQYIQPDVKKFHEYGVLPDVININKVWDEENKKFIPDIRIEFV